KCERSRYGDATACKTISSLDWKRSCSCGSDGFNANIPSSLSCGAVIASAPRFEAYAPSPYAGTAARPSSAPRRMTSTKRASVAASAKTQRGSMAAAPAASAPLTNARLLVMAISSALEFRTCEQQRDALLCAGSARNRDARALVESGAERPLAETQRLLATCNARRDGSSPLDALQQCIRAVPLRRRVRPTRRRARRVRPLSEQIERRGDLARLSGNEIERAERGYDQLVRCLEFRCGPRPRCRSVEHGSMNCRQIAAAVDKRFGDVLDGVGRRLIGNEMPRKLQRDVPCCRRMSGEVGEHCARLGHARLTVARAENRLGARLMRDVMKCELARLAAAGKSIGTDRPAGERTRECGDVLLRVTAVYAERVQLENLAREVLVDAEFAIAVRSTPVATLRELRVRSNGSLVVQVQNHRGMRLDGGQHVRESTRNVRPDRLVLQRAREREDLRLVGGNREVVGPEVDQALAKRFFGVHGDAIPRGDLIEVVRNELRPQAAGQAIRGGAVAFRVVAVTAQLGIGLEDLRRTRQATDFLGLRARAGQLLLQPAACIVARTLQLAGTGAKAEAICRSDGVESHVVDNELPASRLTSLERSTLECSWPLLVRSSGPRIWRSRCSLC